jgi:predicted nucleotidyltransferase
MSFAVRNKEGVLRQLSFHRAKIRSYGVSRLGIFGSFARNKAIREDSDIDFLVEFDKDKKSFDNFMDLSFYLEELFGRKVEIVTLQSLSKYIGPHILKEVENVPL